MAPERGGCGLVCALGMWGRIFLSGLLYMTVLFLPMMYFERAFGNTYMANLLCTIWLMVTILGLIAVVCAWPSSARTRKGDPSATKQKREERT